MEARGAAGDAAGLDHIDKQPEIGEIEAHSAAGRGFEFGEVRIAVGALSSPPRRASLAVRADQRLSNRAALRQRFGIDEGRLRRSPIAPVLPRGQISPVVTAEP
jgi:hypothetical protein